MELTKAFPPADDLLAKLQEIDYRKHYNNFMDAVETFCIYVAAIAVVIWEKLQVLKFKTPDAISDYIYFSVNFVGDPTDEIIGFSIGNRYIGFYNRNIVWGVLNENGALDD